MIKNCCIFYLVNNNPIHIKRLFDSLDCLVSNFTPNNPYKVVFGYEYLDDNVINQIKQHSPKDHYFHKLEFKLPEYPEIIKSQIPEKFKGNWDENAHFSMGYRHMCRYFSGEIYKDQLFENVNYLLRLDCDSYFTGPVKYDIFEYMQSNQLNYASVGKRNDEEEYVIEGLKEHLQNMFGPDYEIKSMKSRYDTHFEIVNFQRFKQQDYIELYNNIDKTGNIYIKRWGDAPIKFHLIDYLIPANQIHIFDLPYKHGGNLK